MKAMKYSLLLVSALLCFSMNGAVNADGFQADNMMPARALWWGVLLLPMVR